MFYHNKSGGDFPYIGVEDRFSKLNFINGSLQSMETTMVYSFK